MSFIRLKKQHMIFCQCIFLTPTELLPMKLVHFFSSLMVSVWPEFSDCVFLREVDLSLALFLSFSDGLDLSCSAISF